MYSSELPLVESSYMKKSEHGCFFFVCFFLPSHRNPLKKLLGYWKCHSQKKKSLWVKKSPTLCTISYIMI